MVPQAGVVFIVAQDTLMVFATTKKFVVNLHASANKLIIKMQGSRNIFKKFRICNAKKIIKKWHKANNQKGRNNYC
jgi:hypothetical protein